MTTHAFKKTVVAAAVIAVVAALPAKAQMGRWGSTIYGTGEGDSDDVGFLLAGVSLAPQMRGWGPLVGVEGHWLRYSPPGARFTNSGVQPYAGLQNNYGTGLFGVRVGYRFEKNDAVVSAPTSIATGDGVVLTSQLEHWGTGTDLGGQGLATYNFGSKTFWGRGRVDMPIAQLAPGALRLGAEAAFLNVASDPPDAPASFSTTSVGPILIWQTGRGVNLGIAAGKRFGDSDATYFRLDVAIFQQK